MKKKIKKETPVILIDTAHGQSRRALWLNAAVRIFLLCLVTAGTCLVTVQIYKIPVNELQIILTSIGWALIFNILFIVLKFRYALPLIFLAGLINFNLDTFLYNLGCFTDFFLLRLDSRVLYTSQFAGRPLAELSDMSQGFQYGIQESFLVFCALIALIYAMAGRGRFIGSVLITVVVIMLPAFGAEFAMLCSGMLPLIAGMFGLYSIWAAGEHGLPNKANVQPVKRKNGKKRRHKVIAGLPRINRHTANGVIAVIIAFTSYSAAMKLFPAEKTAELFKFISNVNEEITDFWFDMVDKFNGSFSGEIENNGYFPSDFISSSLSLDAPSISTRRVMNVTREDINNPLFLKVDIGVSMNDDKFAWDKNSNDPKVKQLNELMEFIYPEHEYLLFRQKLSTLKYADPDAYMGLQQVSIEYFVSTKNVVLPTFPYLPKFKDNFNWNLDTAIKSKRNTAVLETQVWDILYPKVSAYAFNSAVSDVNATYNSASYYGEFSDGNDDYIRVYSSADFGGQTVYNALITILTDEDGNYYFSLNNKKYPVTINENGESYYEVEGEKFPIAPVLNEAGEYTVSTTVVSDNFSNVSETVTRMVWGSLIDTCASEYGLTAMEYIGYTEQYKELVNEIYTTGSKIEEQNISRLKSEMDASGQVNFKLPKNYKSAVFVRQVADYFINNYDYSLTADNKSGENTILGNFLFDTRKGHCALYATAMTLLLRSEGIPARYVTGYAVNGGEENADGTYTYTVLERDLHAWVEVYYSDAGWIPYDPTPPITESVFDEVYGNTASETASRTTIATTTAVTTTTAATTPKTEITTTETSKNTLNTEPEGINPEQEPSGFTIPSYVITIVIIGAAVLLIVVLTVLFIKALQRAERKRLERFKAVRTRKTAGEVYSFIVRLLKTEGLTAETGELPSEFALRAKDALNTDIDFSEIMFILEKLEFSEEELTEAEYSALGEFAAELYKKTVTEKGFFTGILRKIVINDIL